MTVYKLILVLLMLPAGAAFADLLDDDDTPKPVPTAASEPAPAPPPAPGSRPSKSAKATKPSTSLRKDEAEKPASGVASSGFLSPKSKGKKSSSGQKHDGEQPVEFQSEGLKGLREKGYVELQKNVVVTQGSMRLEADHAQAYYDELSKELIKVVCDGNVKMFKDDENSGDKIKAYGDSVVFLNKERKATMEGNARLWRGSDLVRGKKITYEMDTGWIRADRVAGELRSGDKGVTP